jgi:hypothetical protein
MFMVEDGQVIPLKNPFEEGGKDKVLHPYDNADFGTYFGSHPPGEPKSTIPGKPNIQAVEIEPDEDDITGTQRAVPSQGVV